MASRVTVLSLTGSRRGVRGLSLERLPAAIWYTQSTLRMFRWFTRFRHPHPAVDDIETGLQSVRGLLEDLQGILNDVVDLLPEIEEGTDEN